VVGPDILKGKNEVRSRIVIRVDLEATQAVVNMTAEPFYRAEVRRMPGVIMKQLRKVEWIWSMIEEARAMFYRIRALEAVEAINHSIYAGFNQPTWWLMFLLSYTFRNLNIELDMEFEEICLLTVTAYVVSSNPLILELWSSSHADELAG